MVGRNHSHCCEVMTSVVPEIIVCENLVFGKESRNEPFTSWAVIEEGT